MKVIFIRGLPGTGKTPIAHNLENKLKNSEVIHLDDFNIKATKKDVLESAYKKVVNKLYLLYKKNKEHILIEGVICDKYFSKMLNEFVTETKSTAYWFRLEKPLENLLIKNSKETLLKIEKDMDNCNIKDEHYMKNYDPSLTVEKILEIIS